jgi:hypothetical protein
LQQNQAGDSVIASILRLKENFSLRQPCGFCIWQYASELKGGVL